MPILLKIAATLFLVQLSFFSVAQLTPMRQSTNDSLKEFEIMRAPSMRSLKIDSVTTLQTLAGGAIIKQGGTIFHSDSAVINPNTHIIEAFGNIHINQGDTVHTYGQYLKYLGVEKMAYLKKNVKLTDGKGSLTTQDLDYNMGSGIGNFYNGGKVIEGKNVITSKDGTYYSDTKDVYFKTNVEVKGPKNYIRTDSLLYNMATKVSSFITKTYIKNDEVEINTTQGTYDLKTGNAYFTQRTSVKDSTGRIYTADNMALDDQSGNAQLEGNAVIIDTANHFIVIANQIFLNKKNNSFLATRKPVLIIKQKNDSTYIAADTIFSGISTRIESGKLSMKLDTTHNINLQQDKKVSDFVKDSIHLKNTILPLEKKDSISTIVKDTLSKLKGKLLIESPPINHFNKSEKDSITIHNKELVKESDSIRYFIAFHHVRIFNDSLQSVSDSMYFSTKDSVIRLYYDPIIWSGNTQITGDTIFLFTQNQQPKRLYAFEKGMIVNRTKEGFFNQMAGKTINGYFVDGKIDYMNVRGSQSESIYYLQDDDQAYIGMNRASGDVINLYFLNEDLKKVIFINEINGVIFPMGLVPPDQKELKNFKWLDAQRPKNKLELFE
jgi:lipopolysaccharide export system protein LptA